METFSFHCKPRARSSNWKLTLAYDGTDFDGWQVQPGRRTVQGELANALERITGERVLPQGSGRTDAGVHALAQVASFRLAAPIPAQNLQRALNRTLPGAIRILSAQQAGEDFHARHSALRKTYEYRICRSNICAPWLARYVYHYDAPLDMASMRRAATFVIGEHDFTSFAASEPDRTVRERLEVESSLAANRRTVRASSWEVDEAEKLLIYRVTGSGFLHHMVRNLVGTFIEVGRGRIVPEVLPEIIAARSRSEAGPTAPARGLFLVSVDYKRE